MSNESMANHITETPSEIAELLAENKLLREELEKEKGVVEFYGEGNNWQPFEDKSNGVIWDEDQGYYDDLPPFRSCKLAPGKRARQRIAERREV